jgi:cytochrome c oxidase subunit IV
VTVNVTKTHLVQPLSIAIVKHFVWNRLSLLDAMGVTSLLMLITFNVVQMTAFWDVALCNLILTDVSEMLTVFIITALSKPSAIR